MRGGVAVAAAGVVAGALLDLDGGRRGGGREEDGDEGGDELGRAMLVVGSLVSLIWE